MKHCYLRHLVLTIALSPSAIQLCAQDAEVTGDIFTASAYRNVDVASQESGIVNKLAISEGATVQPGDVLVKLNDRIFEWDAVRTAAELRMADLEKSSDADLRFAEKSAEYNEVLLERFDSAISTFAGSVSKTEREQAALELKKSLLSIEQAKLQLELAAEKFTAKKAEKETADRRLKLRTIRSTLAGTVVEILVDEGEWVQAGESITRIVDYRRMKITGYVPAEKFSTADVGKKLLFQAVRPRVPGDPKFEATITFVSPEIEPKFFSNPKVRIVAEMDNPKLKVRINSEMRLVD